ncbi:MAG: 3-deoxy-7-phosphoheptulonate synthase [Lactobacillales bacterium]|nr:3-deoxy-7-phosphoheptulonate synthase [Lactobacillales bacterium]
MVYKAKSDVIDSKKLKEVGSLSVEACLVKEARDRELRYIMEGRDSRLLLIIGPCSAHDEEAVMEYAHRLAKLQEEVKGKMFLVMRVYTNKPRTNGDGYKGLMHQPNLEEAVDPLLGISATRKLHARVITETRLTTADEMLYPENLIFVDDLVSYHAVGARSVEDQQHRFVASGIDAPTGLKNPTSGNLNILFHALHAVQKPQDFLYNFQEVVTLGNPWAHVILRGASNEYGENQPNYYYEDLLKAVEFYEKKNFLNPCILVDTNHDNSGKKYLDQVRIVRQTLINRRWNEKLWKHVRGFMIESFLVDGRQEVDGKVFGQSITDPCLGWEKTEALVREIFQEHEVCN